MRRSSESIACLAAALAKAQACSPIRRKPWWRPSEQMALMNLSARSAMSSGLEIVRKTLGQHEIAALRTTAIDQTAGIVNLTTVLAHSSGEWIASDWPVCAVSETATPHPDGSGADVCSALCALHVGRDCRGGRHRCSRSHDPQKSEHKF
jgi:hypothetical protein